jgi:hypothetical protein
VVDAGIPPSPPLRARARAVMELADRYGVLSSPRATGTRASCRWALTRRRRWPPLSPIGVTVTARGTTIRVAHVGTGADSFVLLGDALAESPPAASSSTPLRVARAVRARFWMTRRSRSRSSHPRGGRRRRPPTTSHVNVPVIDRRRVAAGASASPPYGHHIGQGARSGRPPHDSWPRSTRNCRVLHPGRE